MLKLFKKVLPPKQYAALEQFLFFKPEDPFKLYQMPAQRAVAGLTPVERIKGYRYPAPGSQPPARIPLRHSVDEIYNNNHSPRDFRNLPVNRILYIPTTEKTVAFDYDLTRSREPQKRKIGSLDYDPTQLRTTKTANWAALQKSVLKHAPDHLPLPFWVKEKENLAEERKRKGLPPPIGGRLFTRKEEDKHFVPVQI